MVKKILVIQLRQLGDILLTTPVIRELKKAFPNSHITFLSHRMGKLILDNNPYLDEHLVYDESSSLSSELKLFIKLRRTHFDFVFDFMFNPKSCLYVLASKSNLKVSFASNRSVFFHQVVKRGGDVYIVDEKFRLLREVGITPSEFRLDLPWFEKDLGPVAALYTKKWFSDASLRVVLAPTHRRAVRAWPLERFSKLASHLKREWNAEIIWLWGPGEESVIDKVIEMTTEETHKAPKTTFRELAALVSHCDLFIGNSNGPSHVAVAADIHSLQLHGPTLASSWCPMTSKHYCVQSGDGSIEGLVFEEVWSELERMRESVFRSIPDQRAKGIQKNWKDIHSQ